MSINLTAQDKTTVQTAAYGAIDLLAAASIGSGPGKIAADGYLALFSTTGPIGHVLAEKRRAAKPEGKSVAAYAEQVLPALTGAVRLLKAQDPTQAAEFRAILRTAIDAATAGRVTAPLESMIGKINAALDAGE
ncbi:hypothetical protein Afil01_60150 [Actinorhabdospora filicis]|uniref:Uncharacterized protein n=1 Tax=Actinorhabdospora filicis TaxID=1785913 RepID=A0A9W6SSD6_9ACTN|nr:hypothetical protein [Actinorhabdospora filicis]GLZ81208.1 hypothetical protein Afil01_60150 [Actinorhabdospora filicis]